MTDQTPPPVPPEEPSYAATPAPQPYSAAGQQPYGQPYPGGTYERPKQTLSLTSFIAGIAAFVFSWVPFLGLIVSIVAIITGFMAMSREKAAPKWMWIIGLVGGFLGLLGALFFTGALILGLVLSAQYGTSTY
jgi:hypothetical protein